MFTVDVGLILVQALEQEYGCQLCIGPCTTRGEVGGACLCYCYLFVYHVRSFVKLVFSVCMFLGS